MDAGGRPDPIRRISVLSTGSVRIRPEHGHRSWRPIPLWLLTSQRWTPPLPINVYVVEHERGLVLFDAGQALIEAVIEIGEPSVVEAHQV